GIRYRSAGGQTRLLARDRRQCAGADPRAGNWGARGRARAGADLRRARAPARRRPFARYFSHQRIRLRAGAAARARLARRGACGGLRSAARVAFSGCRALAAGACRGAMLYHGLAGRTPAFFRRSQTYRPAVSRRSSNMSTLAVSVWRGGSDGRFQTFMVPRLDAQTVLDVVTHIQRRLDPTLAYRFACRVGMCGSCAMTVNGEPRWTCRTHVANVERNGKLTIAPLAHLPIVREIGRAHV